MDVPPFHWENRIVKEVADTFYDAIKPFGGDAIKTGYAQLFPRILFINSFLCERNF